MRVAPQTIDELDAVEALMHLQDSHPSEPMRAPLTSRPIVERNVNEAYVDDDEVCLVEVTLREGKCLPLNYASTFSVAEFQ